MHDTRPDVPLQRVHEATPWVFGLLALIATLLSIWTLPPFQAPDETAHLLRADVLTFGPAALSRTDRDGDAVVSAQAHAAIRHAEAPRACRAMPPRGSAAPISWRPTGSA